MYLISVTSLCLLLVAVTSVRADFQFELKLIRYHNPSHRLAPNERCCDSDLGLTQCVDHCDNSLHFCISPPGHGQGDCSLGQLSTGPLIVKDPARSDDVPFGSGEYIADSVKNPLVFTGQEWPGGFDLEVDVEDEDDGGVFEAVDVISVSRPTGIRPSSRFSSAEEIRGNGGRGFLRYSYRLTCSDGFTGERCDIPLTELVSPDVCSGSPCQNGGVCSAVSATTSDFKCSCPPGFGESRPTSTPPPLQTATVLLSQPTPSQSSVVVTVPREEGGGETVRVVAAVASCVLVAMTALLLLSLVFIFLLLRQRARGGKGGGEEPGEQTSEEEGMYANPTYAGSGTCTRQPDISRTNSRETGNSMREPASSGVSVREMVRGGAVYEDPRQVNAVESEQPVRTDSRTSSEAYHKILNPLYTSTSSLHTPIPQYCTIDTNPYYATPSFSSPHSHTNMEHRLTH